MPEHRSLRVEAFYEFGFLLPQRGTLSSTEHTFPFNQKGNLSKRECTHSLAANEGQNGGGHYLQVSGGAVESKGGDLSASKLRGQNLSATTLRG